MNRSELPNQRLRDIYDSCDGLLNFSNLSWWIIDLKDDPNSFYCNQTMCEAFALDGNLTRHSVVETCPIAGDYIKNVAIRSSDKANQIFSEYHKLRTEGGEYKNSFPYYDSRTDQTLYFSSRARVLVESEAGQAEVLFGLIEPEDVSAELYEKARTDALTGLFNRREFDSQIELLLGLAIRDQRKISLLMCDIDHFKQYNDALGHFAGDECLMQVARLIADLCARRSDVACRYGGEEFAVIAYGNDNDAGALAESIRREVYSTSIPHPVLDNSPVTISVGYYSIVPDRSVTPRGLIEGADKALYQAKQAGRNLCVQHKGSCGHDPV